MESNLIYKSSYSRIVKKINIKKELSNRGIEGKVSNGNLMICCPFHLDAHPSLGILLDTKDKKQVKGYWQCQSFNCEEKGNSLTLISKLDDVPYKTVLKKFKRELIVNNKIIKKIKKSFSKKIKVKKLKDIRTINDFNLSLFKNPYGKFLSYLKGDKRKLTLKTIEKFGVLCCDNKKWNEGAWKNRVIIPCYDLNNNLISLVARSVIKDIDKTKKIRKLKNTDRKKVLFGLNKIKNKSTLFLCEGEFDAIYLQQNKIPAVSVGCKSISPDQKELLIKHSNKVIINFDGDIELSKLKKIKVELDKYMDTELLKLPDGKDPNELTKQEVKKIYSNYLGG